MLQWRQQPQAGHVGSCLLVMTAQVFVNMLEAGVAKPDDFDLMVRLLHPL